MADKRRGTSRVTKNRRASATISFIDGRRVLVPCSTSNASSLEEYKICPHVDSKRQQLPQTVWTWHPFPASWCDNTGLQATSLTARSVSCGAHNMGASDGQLSPSQSSSSVTRQHVGRSCPSNPVFGNRCYRLTIMGQTRISDP